VSAALTNRTTMMSTDPRLGSSSTGGGSSSAPYTLGPNRFTCRVPFKTCSAPSSSSCPAGYCENCCNESCPTHTTPNAPPTQTGPDVMVDRSTGHPQQVAQPAQPAQHPQQVYVQHPDMMADQEPFHQRMVLDAYLPLDDMNELYPPIPPDLMAVFRSTPRPPPNAFIPIHEYYDRMARRPVQESIFPIQKPFSITGRRLVALPLNPDAVNVDNPAGDPGFLWAETAVPVGQERIRDKNYIHPLWGPVNGKYNAQQDPKRVIQALEERLNTVVTEREKSEVTYTNAIRDVHNLSITVAELAVRAEQAGLRLTHATEESPELVHEAEVAAANARQATAILSEANARAEQFRYTLHLLYQREELLKELITAFRAENEIGPIRAIPTEPTTILSPGSRPLPYDMRAIEEYSLALDLGVRASNALHEAETTAPGAPLKAEVLNLVTSAATTARNLGLTNLHRPPTSSAKVASTEGRLFAPINFQFSSAVLAAIASNRVTERRIIEWPVSVEAKAADLFANLPPFPITEGLFCPICRRSLTANGIRLHVRQHRVAFLISPTLRIRFREYVEAKTGTPWQINSALYAAVQNHMLNPAGEPNDVIDKHSANLLRRMGVSVPETVVFAPNLLPFTLPSLPPQASPQSVVSQSASFASQRPMIQPRPAPQPPSKPPETRVTPTTVKSMVTKVNVPPETIRNYAVIVSQYLKSTKMSEEAGSEAAHSVNMGQKGKSGRMTAQESSESRLAARVGVSLADLKLLSAQERNALTAGTDADSMDRALAKAESSQRQMQTGRDQAEDEEQDDICCICDEGESEEGNEIVFCDGKCKLAYHQLCVGVRTLPIDEWLCPNCTPRPHEVYAPEYITIASTAAAQARRRRQAAIQSSADVHSLISAQGPNIPTLPPYPPPPRSNIAAEYTNECLDLNDLSTEIHSGSDFWAACEGYFDHSLYETDAWLAYLLPSTDARFYHSLPALPAGADKLAQETDQEGEDIPKDVTVETAEVLTSGGMMMLSYGSARSNRRRTRDSQSVPLLPDLDGCTAQIQGDMGDTGNEPSPVPSTGSTTVGGDAAPFSLDDTDFKLGEVRLPIFKATLLADLLAFNFSPANPEEADDPNAPSMQVLPGIAPDADHPTGPVNPSFVLRVPLMEFKKKQGGMTAQIKRKIEFEQVKTSVTRWHQALYPEMYPNLAQRARPQAPLRSPVEDGSSAMVPAESSGACSPASPTAALPGVSSAQTLAPVMVPPLPLSEMTSEHITQPGAPEVPAGSSNSNSVAVAAEPKQTSSSHEHRPKRRRPKFFTTSRRTNQQRRLKMMKDAKNAGDDSDDSDDEDEGEEESEAKKAVSIFPPSDEIGLGPAAALEAAWRMMRPLPPAAATDVATAEPVKRATALSRALKTGEMAMFSLHPLLPPSSRVRWDFPTERYDPLTGAGVADTIAYTLYYRGLFPMGAPNPAFGYSVNTNRSGAHLLSARLRGNSNGEQNNVALFGTMVAALNASGVLTDTLVSVLQFVRNSIRDGSCSGDMLERLQRMYQALCAEFENDSQLLTYVQRWAEYALSQVPSNSPICRIPILSPLPTLFRNAAFEAVYSGLIGRTFQAKTQGEPNDGREENAIAYAQTPAQRIGSLVAQESLERTRGLFGVALSSQSWATIVPLALTTLPPEDDLLTTYVGSQLNNSSKSPVALGPINLQRLQGLRAIQQEMFKSRRPRRRDRERSHARRGDDSGSQSEDSDDSADMDQEHTTPVVTPRPRGRPRLSGAAPQKSTPVAAAPAAVPQKTVPEIKRGRGRPRKSEALALAAQRAAQQAAERAQQEEEDPYQQALKNSMLRANFETIRAKEIDPLVSRVDEEVLQPALNSKGCLVNAATARKNPPTLPNNPTWVRFSIPEEYTRALASLNKPTVLPRLPDTGEQLVERLSASTTVEDDDGEDTMAISPKSELGANESRQTHAEFLRERQKQLEELRVQAEARRRELAEQRITEPQWWRAPDEVDSSLQSMPAPEPPALADHGVNLSTHARSLEHFEPITVCPFLRAPTAQEVRESIAAAPLFVEPNKPSRHAYNELAEWEELFGSQQATNAIPLAVREVLEDLLNGKIPAQGSISNLQISRKHDTSSSASRRGDKSAGGVPSGTDAFTAAKHASAAWVSPARYPCYHTASTVVRPDGEVIWQYEGVLQRVIGELEQAIRKAVVPLLQAFSQDRERTEATMAVLCKKLNEVGLEDVGVLFKPRPIPGSENSKSQSKKGGEDLDDRSLMTLVVRDFTALRDPSFDETYSADSTQLQDDLWLLSRQLEAQQLANNILKLKVSRRMLEIIRASLSSNPYRMIVLPVTGRALYEASSGTQAQSAQPKLARQADSASASSATEQITCEPISIPAPPNVLANLAAQSCGTYSIDNIVTTTKSKDHRDLRYKPIGSGSCNPCETPALGSVLSEFNNALGDAVSNRLQTVCVPDTETPVATTSGHGMNLPDYFTSDIEVSQVGAALANYHALKIVPPSIRHHFPTHGNDKTKLIEAKTKYARQYVPDSESEGFSGNTPSNAPCNRDLILPPYASPYSSAPSQLYSPLEAVDTDIRVLQAARALDRAILTRKTLEVRRKAALFRLQDPNAIAAEVAATVATLVELVASSLEYGHRPNAVAGTVTARAANQPVRSKDADYSQVRRRIHVGEYGYSVELFTGTRYMAMVAESQGIPQAQINAQPPTLTRHHALNLSKHDLIAVVDEKFMQMRSLVKLLHAGFRDGHRPVSSKRWVLSPTIGSTLLRFPTPLSAFLERCLPDIDKFTSHTPRHRPPAYSLHEAVLAHGVYGFVRGLSLQSLVACGLCVKVFTDPLSIRGRSEPLLVSRLSTASHEEQSTLTNNSQQATNRLTLSMLGNQTLRAAYQETENFSLVQFPGTSFWGPSAALAQLNEEQRLFKMFQTSIWSNSSLTDNSPLPEVVAVCTCKQLYSSPFFVACDTCNVWFHIDCGGQDERSGMSCPLEPAKLAAVSRWDCPTCCSVIMTSQRQTTASSSLSSGTTPKSLPRRFDEERRLWKRYRLRELFFDVGLDLVDLGLKVLRACAELQILQRHAPQSSTSIGESELMFGSFGPWDMLRAQSAVDLDSARRGAAFGIRMTLPGASMGLFSQEEVQKLSKLAKSMNAADMLITQVLSRGDTKPPILDRSEATMTLMRQYGVIFPGDDVSMNIVENFAETFDLNARIAQLRMEPSASPNVATESGAHDALDEGYDGAGIVFDEETMAERAKFIRMDQLWREYDQRYEGEAAVPNLYPYGLRIALKRTKVPNPPEGAPKATYEYKGIYHGQKQVEIASYMNMLMPYITPSEIIKEFAELWPARERDSNGQVRKVSWGDDDEDMHDGGAVQQEQQEASPINWEEYLRDYRGPFSYPKKVIVLPARINKWRAGVIARLPQQMQSRARNYAKRWQTVYITGLPNDDVPDEPDEYRDEFGNPIPPPEPPTVGSAEIESKVDTRNASSTPAQTDAAGDAVTAEQPRDDYKLRSPSQPASEASSPAEEVKETSFPSEPAARVKRVKLSPGVAQRLAQTTEKEADIDEEGMTDRPAAAAVSQTLTFTPMTTRSSARLAATNGAGSSDSGQAESSALTSSPQSHPVAPTSMPMTATPMPVRITRAAAAAAAAASVGIPEEPNSTPAESHDQPAAGAVASGTSAHSTSSSALARKRRR